MAIPGACPDIEMPPPNEDDPKAPLFAADPPKPEVMAPNPPAPAVDCVDPNPPDDGAVV